MKSTARHGQAAQLLGTFPEVTHGSSRQAREGHTARNAPSLKDEELELQRSPKNGTENRAVSKAICLAKLSYVQDFLCVGI